MAPRPGKSPSRPSAATLTIDRWMDDASRALEATQYFECQELCVKALTRAHKLRDYDRMARVLNPLQECRRQIRQTACDTGLCFVLTDLPRTGADLVPGCYLLQPPLIGVDSRTVRELAARAQTPVVVLVREPMTSAGKWPIVAVGAGVGERPRGPSAYPVSFRVQVEPPYLVQPRADRPTKDTSGAPPSVAWFLATGEALGDAAIARINPGLAASYRVDELIDALDAHPDHEKLHQRLADACREALAQPEPPPRRRGAEDDPRSF